MVIVNLLKLVIDLPFDKKDVTTPSTAVQTYKKVRQCGGVTKPLPVE